MLQRDRGTKSLHSDIPGSTVVAILLAKPTGCCCPGQAPPRSAASRHGRHQRRPAGPERVGKSELRADIPIDRAEGSGERSGQRAGLERGKSEVQIRLRERLRPAQNPSSLSPMAGGLRRGGGRTDCAHQRHDKTEIGAVFLSRACGSSSGAVSRH